MKKWLESKYLYMGKDLPIWTSMWRGKGHVVKLKRIHIWSYVQPHRLPTGEASSLGPGRGGKPSHGSERGCDQPQGAGALGAEPPPRMGACYGPSHHAGCAPGAMLAFWDLRSYQRQPQALLPCHMSAVRSPRKCLASFYTSVFLLIPSNILDSQDEKNTIS